MAITQEYSILNRKIIAEEIVTHMGWHVVESFTTMHNYIDIENGIMRKGAVSAQKGEKLLIPINMRDGSLLCIGKGNPDWNYSAPHGAGRLMSRSQAKETFTVEEYQKQMEGIYTTSVSQATLDECPMTYKPIESIMDNIEDTAEVVDILKPIYNFKAS
jgi:RNA-splicing ligase RtcB